MKRAQLDSRRGSRLGCPGRALLASTGEARVPTRVRTLLNLNHALTGSGLDLIHSRHYLASKVVK